MNSSMRLVGVFYDNKESVCLQTIWNRQEEETGLRQCEE